MKKTVYDVVVIGGGQAGIPLAHALAGAKMKVVLIERSHLGESCVNFGCIPTKAAIASARVAHLARRGSEFGLPHCQGIRFFCCLNKNLPVKEEKNNVEALFLNYLCRNCERTNKQFAVVITIKSTSEGLGSALKLGERPSFNPPTPARVISLIGPNRETFIKGRRAENQGLGIGAFAYYRRVVENQKGRLIKEMSKVAKRLDADNSIK